MEPDAAPDNFSAKLKAYSLLTPPPAPERNHTELHRRRNMGQPHFSGFHIRAADGCKRQRVRADVRQRRGSLLPHQPADERTETTYVHATEGSKTTVATGVASGRRGRGPGPSAALRLRSK